MDRISIAIAIVLATNVALAARILDKNLGWPGVTLADQECRGKPQGFGPFDYNDPRSSAPGGFSNITGNPLSNPLRMVEIAHFKNYVEALIKGKTGKDPLADIDYTLRAFPNHPRALWAVSRYFLQIPTTDPDRNWILARGLRGTPPPECFFQRAMLFAPEDPMVSMIYGLYLHKRGLSDAALREYLRAGEGMPNHAELAYNTGLLYFELKDYENARKYADKAYELGYPLDGLKRKLAELPTDSSQPVE